MEIKNGEIWKTKSIPVLPDATNLYEIENPYYVFIFDTSKSKTFKEFKTVFVIPVSFEIEHASILDLIVEKENILNKKFMLEVWNTQSMLLNNLDEKIYSFDECFVKDVHRLFDYKNDKSIVVSDIHTGHDSKDNNSHIFNFQKQEIKNTEYLRVPAMLLNKMLEQNNFSASDYIQFKIRIINDILEYSRCSNIRSEPPLVVSQGCRPVMHLLKPPNRFVLAVQRGSFSKNKILRLIKEVENYLFKVSFENVNGKILLSYQITKSGILLENATIYIFKNSEKFDELLFNKNNYSFKKSLDTGLYKIQVNYDNKLIAEEYFRVENES
jgi:hypothetical protein